MPKRTRQTPNIYSTNPMNPLRRDSEILQVRMSARVMPYIAAYNREEAVKVLNRLGYPEFKLHHVHPANTPTGKALTEHELCPHDGTMILSTGWGESGNIARVWIDDDGERYVTLLGHLERKLVFIPKEKEEES